MTNRKHVNLFVRNSPTGAMSSSVIHEWAKDKYDSVTVCYCDDEVVDQEIHKLYKLIRLSESEGANPCGKREIIIIDLYPYRQSLNKLCSLENVHITVCNSMLLSGLEWVCRICKKYLGFFKHKWIYGYRSMYDIANSMERNIDLNILRDFIALRGAEELEHLITAYVHDLKPPFNFDTCDMIDYYHSVFVRRVEHDSNQAECV